MQCIPLLTRTPSETRRVREICTNESLARKRKLHRKGRPTKLKEILQYVYRAGQHTYQIYPKQRKTLYSRENHLDNHQDNLLHQKKMPVHLERGRFCDKVAYLFKKEKKLLLIKKIQFLHIITCSCHHQRIQCTCHQHMEASVGLLVRE